MSAFSLVLGLCLVGPHSPATPQTLASRRDSVTTVVLRIESLTRPRLPVRVLSAPPGLWAGPARRAPARTQLLVTTPAEVDLADSVRVVQIKVRGEGVVRVEELSSTARPAWHPAAWGSDITLARGPNGVFRPVARVRPLAP
jgi:hypothetical protein